MKVTYWIANCLNDSPVYSIRRKTRREVFKVIDEGQFEIGKHYSAPHQVTVEYKNALDLLTQCLSEGGLDEGQWDAQIKNKENES